MSPYNSNYSQVYYSNSNPLHTPESSPTHSPDATHAATMPRNRKTNTSLNGTITTVMARGKNTDDSVAVTSSLPTPEMSPLELEKENYNNSLTNNKQKLSFVDYNGHIKTEKVHASGGSGGGGSVTPTSYAYSSTVNSSARNMSAFDVDAIERHVIKREYNNYPPANSCGNTSAIDGKTSSNSGARSLYHSSIYDGASSLPSNANVDKRNYSSATTSTYSASMSTTIAAGKGMYVTCSSRGILDQGNVVRGTYFPPLATTQDHQNLGTVTSSQTVSASSMSNMNYASNHHHHHHHHHLDGALHLNAARLNSSAGSGGGGGGNGSNLMAKENNNIIGDDAASHNGIPIDGYGAYESVSVTTPMPTYVTTTPFNQQYKEYVNYNQTQSPNANAGGVGQHPMHAQQHQPMGDEVDSREFEKYFKYPDSNHNFNEFDSNSPYHGHPNAIFHNHQIPHVISSPHHPAAIIPQEYYHFYNPNATNVSTGGYTQLFTKKKCLFTLKPFDDRNCSFSFDMENYKIVHYNGPRHPAKNQLI